MKKFTLTLAFFVLLIYSLITSVGASSIMWSQTYGGVDYDSAEAVIQTSDGGYVLAGTSTIIIDDVPTDSYAWLIKTDSEGNIPEFPSWIILPLFLMVSLVALIIRKKIFHSH